MEQKKEKKYIVGSILCGLLTAFGAATSVISLISVSKELSTTENYSFRVIYALVGLVSFALIFFYALVGYKKPHGNLLKYIMLFRVVPGLIGIYMDSQAGNTFLVLLSAFGIGVLCYVSGRLAKAKENLFLMLIIIVCKVICLISDITAGVSNIGFVAPFIIWLDICVAYFLRYKQHREAGLEDAPKSK